MEKMSGKSMDLVAENIAQIKALFPEAVTEGKIDFNVLKALLGDEIEKRQEYYKFTWNGKESARAYARVPSMGTLRPCMEESSGKDGTPGKFDSENLYIEGDNLEVLKLLQGPYHKKVKMIYIDPPYNTGHDFVYSDNFRDSIGNYKALTGQTNAEGVATRANPETSGRYHTDWLNMMYPRLILARNLLTDDGVIFISIDDCELNNLCKICDEVFGEDNFLGCITWIKKTKPINSGNAKFQLQSKIEYVIVYCRSKNANDTYKFILESKGKRVYDYKTPQGLCRLKDILDSDYGTKARDTMKFPILGVTPPSGFRWKIGLNEVNRLIAEKKIINIDGKVKVLVYPDDESEDILDPFWSFIGDKVGTAENGKKELIELMQGNVGFDTVKPVSLVTELISHLPQNIIVVDFFSGTATTANSVMQLNSKDSGNRNFIMVQLPEESEADSDGAKAGYKNICEIGKERIRRAAKKIKKDLQDELVHLQAELTLQQKELTESKEENLPELSDVEEINCKIDDLQDKIAAKKSALAGDMGFKVFKLDTSNIVPWNPNAETLREDLLAAVDNVLIDRTTQDLLYEVLLKCNLPLTLPIEEKKFGGNTVYLVGAGALAICLDAEIPQTIAEEIVKLRDEYAPIVPMQVVFRDNGFTDVTKANALQILKQAGFEEKSVQTI